MSQVTIIYHNKQRRECASWRHALSLVATATRWDWLDEIADELWKEPMFSANKGSKKKRNLTKEKV